MIHPFVINSYGKLVKDRKSAILARAAQRVASIQRAKQEITDLYY
jgi:hypothetical protein